MNKPPAPWPFTGRYYPNGAKLHVVKIHPKWMDLVWHDDRRDVDVYLSTLPTRCPEATETKTTEP